MKKQFVLIMVMLVLCESRWQRKKDPIEKQGSNSREFCDIKVISSNIKLTIDNSITQDIESPYFQGNAVVQGEVQKQGEDCKTLDLDECYTSNKDKLSQGIYLKSMNINLSNLKFTFGFHILYDKTTRMCNVRILQNLGDNKFQEQELILSYISSNEDKKNSLDSLKSFMFGSAGNVENVESQLNACKSVLIGRSQITDNFYRSFAGFLLYSSTQPFISFKCKKVNKQDNKLFRIANDAGLKKIDMFINSDDYSQVVFDNSNKQALSMEEIKLAGITGDNIDPSMKAYNVKISGFSNYNIDSNWCYDLDQINTELSQSLLDFSSGTASNNVQISFSALVKADETPQGAMCGVYPVLKHEDGKYYLQNDMLLRFKQGDSQVTNPACATIFSQWASNIGKLQIFFLPENRYLAGNALNAFLNKDAKMYCYRSILDTVSASQYKEDLKNTQFVQVPVDSLYSDEAINNFNDKMVKYQKLAQDYLTLFSQKNQKPVDNQLIQFANANADVINFSSVFNLGINPSAPVNAPVTAPVNAPVAPKRLMKSLHKKQHHHKIHRR